MLAVIVNAIATTEYGTFLFDTWDHHTYTHDGRDGNYAAITFEGECLVATVFDHDSERSPFRCKGAFDPARFFCGMPASHRPLAERCLTHWHADLRGEPVPLVTAAFWDDGEYLSAAESWDQVWEHGASVIGRQLIGDSEAALAEWQVAHQLSPEEVTLTRSLFRSKMGSRHAVVEPEPAEVRILKDLAGERENYEIGRQAFAAIGIHLPPWED